MKITYDKYADAMSIVLADAEVEETKSVAPGFFADYDADGRVIALEILRTAQKYDFDLTDIQPPNPLPLSLRSRRNVWPQPNDSETPNSQGSPEGRKVRTQLDDAP